MKIAFINLFYRYALNCPPHGILSLIGFLNREFCSQVKIKYFDELPGVNIEKEVLNFSPDLIGISSFTCTIDRAYELVGYFKRNTNAIVVLGGLHPSVRPEESLKYADYVVIGEGERGLADLVRSILKGEKYLLKKIYSSAIEDLDSLPALPYDLLDRKYYSYNTEFTQHLLDFKKDDKYIALLTSRGCPYRCIFCYSSKWPLKLRYFSTKRIISDIEYFIDIWKINYFIFSDDDFLFNRERLYQFCALIKERKLKFQWFCNANVNTIDSEVLKLIKEHGCVWVAYGFESGSNKVLTFLKGQKLDINKNRLAIKITKKIGIKICGYFMIAVPNETFFDLIKTYCFALFRSIDIVSIGRTIVYPGTKLWDYCLENNIFTDEKRDFKKPFRYVYLNDKFMSKRIFELSYRFFRLAILIKYFLQRKYSLKEILVQIKETW